MNLFNSIRRFRRKHRKEKKVQRRRFNRRTVLEWLEERTVLSGNVFFVNSTADFDSDPTKLTLREAILAANAALNGTELDEIRFNIPAGDPGHVYYQNDGLPGLVSTAKVTATTAATDSELIDADPDWPHSWFRIQLLATLPSISEAVFIDAYTQSEAKANALPIGSDAVLRIELDGTNAGSNASGLVVAGDGNTIRGLAINRFRGSVAAISGFGIYLNLGDNNVVEGNYLGTDVAGILDLGNSTEGLYLRGSSNNRIGGPAPAARNVISGNNDNGISFFLSSASANLVENNYIGINAAGTAALGNSNNGVSIGGGATSITIGGTSPGAGNVISGNSIDGIVMAGTGGSHLIQSNFIGTDPTGTIDLGNLHSGVQVEQANNTIGGMTPAARNVISGNNEYGVLLTSTAATGNTVLGNFIGTNAVGTGALGNSGAGVGLQAGARENTIGGATSGEGNVLSANGWGVLIQQSSANQVLGNLIGTQSDGTSPLGNRYMGVQITDASDNRIGGTDSGAGNTIANSGFDGVNVFFAQSGTGNAILGNRIFANAELGIDLDPNGVNPNDPGDTDTGGNNRQNYPVLTSAQATATSTTIEGILNSTPLTAFRLEFFANAAADPTGFGEGDKLLGAIDVNTNTSGDANFTATFASPVAAGQFITATATVRQGTGTPTFGDTSEFARAIQVPPQIQQSDFGDAASPYPTLLADNGARHLIVSGFHLGSGIDGETDGQPSADADGDDANGDDEDGVVFVPMRPGQTMEIEVTASDAGFLDAWVDFNADGDWTDFGEQVFASRPLLAGANPLTFQVPISAALQDVYGRFRFSSAGGLSYNGPAADGEVEDYAVPIDAVGTMAGRVFDDRDGDGQQATDEPGLAGWGVFIDENNNGAFDSDERMTTTEGGGNYTFAGLEPGDYVVGQILPPNWIETLPVYIPERVYALGTRTYFNPEPSRTYTVVDMFDFDLFQRGNRYPDELQQGRATDIEIGPGGDVYVAVDGLDEGTDRIVQFTYDLRFVRVIELPADVNPDLPEGFPDFYPQGFDILADGSLLVAQPNSHQIVQLDPDGSIAETFGLAYSPKDAGTTSDGFIVFSEDGLLNVRPDDLIWYSPRIGSADGTELRDIAGEVIAERPRSTEALETRDGSLFIVDGGSDVLKLDADGNELVDRDVDAGQDVYQYFTYLRSLAVSRNEVPYGNGPVRDGAVPQGFLAVGPEGTELLSDAQITQSGIDELTTPNPVATGLGTWRVHVDAYQIVPGVDFGVFEVSTASGQKYEDVDGDRTHDESEPGLDGWVIWADLDGDGIRDGHEPFDTTHNGGFYTITGIPPGTYTIREEIQAPWIQTEPDGGYYERLFVSGSVLTDLDFGNRLILDYGDAPAPYPTLREFNGARHAIDSRVRLGNAIDAELDGQPDASALGDDQVGVDDEDGVIFTPLFVGEMADVQVTASIDGLLSAWIDFNVDGDWADPGEQIFADKPLTAGVNRVNFPVPAAASLASTFARVRFSTGGGLSFDGLALDGEVEDYEVLIEQPGEIHGGKWEDTDGDRVWDDGEPGLAGWVIFVDLDHNGQFDSVEPWTTTDAQGAFAFSHILPGTYEIGEILQPDWHQSYPPAPGDGLLPATQSVTMVRNEIIGGVNFGNFRLGEIHGSKWNDLNANGIWDDGEPALEGWTIFLDLDGDGIPDAAEPTTVTDANGDYSFLDLIPGDYVVGEALQAGWEQTFPFTRGNESRANTTLGPYFYQPNVAIDDSGQFVVVWEDERLWEEPNRIFGQRFAASAQPLGQEFLIRDMPSSQAGTDLAMAPGGDFVVVWSSDAGGVNSYDITAQRYGADGTDLGAPFRVNASTPGDQKYPSVAMDRMGNFVVVWASGDNGGDGWDILGQRFDADGNPLGDEFRINTLTEGRQDFPRAAMNGAGDLVVVWQSFPDDTQITDVYAQRYSADGAPVGGEFLASGQFGSTGNASAAVDEAGNFVIAWYQVHNGIYVYAQRYTAAGTPLGEAFQVSEVHERLDFVDLREPLACVAMDPEGNFVVTWVDLDGSLTGVFAKRYMADGREVAPFLVNTTTTGWQAAHESAMNGSGDVVTVWTSVPDEDVVSGDIFARRLGTPASHAVAVGSGQVAENIDFGNFQPGEIHGSKWNDLDDDGMWDNGEPGMPDWVIYLDTNQNGQLDEGEPVTATDAAGAYAFRHVPADTYWVQEVIPPGWRQTFGAIPEANVVDLDPLEISDGNDFGNFYYFSTLEGLKFHDQDGDGSRDAGEPGLDGWVIFVDLNGNGLRDAEEPFDTTHDGGFFRIAAEIPDGTFRVREQPQAGWAYTAPAAGHYELDFVEGSRHTGLVFGNRTAIDYGDAPDPTYPTLVANNGASHKIRPGFFLGSRVDDEPDGQPGALADGDDNHGGLDDEDGIEFLTVPLLVGQDASIRVTASAPGNLDAWIDFNADGDWQDPGEQIFARHPLLAGSQVLHFTVPSYARDSYARFRFSSLGGLSFDGLAEDGEVEDYRFTVTSSCAADEVFVDGDVLHLTGDLNDNQFQVTVDPAGQIFVSDLAMCSSAFAGIRRIVADMKSGDDQVSFLGPTAGMLSPIEVEFHAGLGDDQVRFDNWIGNLMIDLDAGDDRAAIFEIGGGNPDPSGQQLTIVAGQGDDEIEVTNANFSDIVVDLGAGDDVANFTSAAPLSTGSRRLLSGLFLGGAGADLVKVEVSSPATTSNLEIDLGDGDDQSRLSLLGDGSVRFSAGAGDDEAQIQIGLLAPEENLSLDLDLGAGDDRVGLDIDPTADGSVRFSVVTGTGDDMVNVTASGSSDLSADIDLGAGDDVANFASPAPLSAGSRRLLSGLFLAGAGADLVKIDVSSPATTSDLQIDLGNGDDQSRLSLMGDGSVRFSAGAGDDDVNLISDGFFDVFVDLGDGNDNIAVIGSLDRTPPTGQTPVWEVQINTGSGVDGVVCDVHLITLIDVLASVKIMGVGLLAILTEFPLGALSMAQAVQADRQASSSQTSLTLDGRDVTIDVSSGPSDDLIDLRIDPTHDGSVRFSADTGRGNDAVNANISSFFDVIAELNLGAGNDTAKFNLKRGGVIDPSGKVREVHVKVLGGAGNDNLQSDIDARAADLIFVDFDGGNGNDLIRVSYQETQTTALPARKLHIHVLGGNGNDDLALSVVTSRPNRLLDLLLDGGKGRDRGSATPNVKVKNCESFLPLPANANAFRSHAKATAFAKRK